MKTLKNKKGFTIVELVIVIAVIAILAAVLIPTFSNIVSKAKESEAMQSAKNAYTDWLAEDKDHVMGLNSQNLCIKSGDYYFHVTAGQFDAESVGGKDHTDSSGEGSTKYTAYEVTEGKLAEVKTEGGTT